MWYKEEKCNFLKVFFKTFGGNGNSVYLCIRFTKQATWQVT